jgi:micrococcal nuclease
MKGFNEYLAKKYRLFTLAVASLLIVGSVLVDYFGNNKVENYKQPDILDNSRVFKNENFPVDGLNKYKLDNIRIIDGDTIFADIVIEDFDLKISKSIRLFGINAPELRGESQKEGERSKEFLRDTLDNQEVFLYKVKQQDKFGRVLGIIFIDTLNVNEMIFESGHAILY